MLRSKYNEPVGQQCCSDQGTELEAAVYLDHVDLDLELEVLHFIFLLSPSITYCTEGLCDDHGGPCLLRTSRAAFHHI